MRRINIASLDVAERRRKRVLPYEYASAADPHEPPGQPVFERFGLPDRLV